MSKTIKVKYPATGELIQEVTRHTVEEINRALENGQKGFEKWAKVNAHERSRLLKAWSQKIQENKEEIAKVMTMENGKPLQESIGEVNYATSYIDWYAEEAVRIYGRTIPASSETKRITVSRQPIGKVAAITP